MTEQVTQPPTTARHAEPMFTQTTDSTSTQNINLLRAVIIYPGQ